MKRLGLFTLLVQTLYNVIFYSRLDIPFLLYLFRPCNGFESDNFTVNTDNELKIIGVFNCSNIKE